MDCSPSKRWKSDTKMIRGGPIFSVSRWWIGWLMKITCEMLSNSPVAPPSPMQQLFNPMDIRNTTHLRNVAADHEWLAIY